MSADNGIYVLETNEGQQRVIHAQAIENLHWNHVSSSMTSQPVCTRIIEYFGNSKATRNKNVAFYVARKMAETQFTEYGICFIKIDKTWKQILAEAKEFALDEIDAINDKNSDGRWNYDLERLVKITKAA